MRSSRNKNWEDPIVAEVHAVRGQMMAEYNHDFRALMADMMRLQKVPGRKLVKAQPATATHILISLVIQLTPIMVYGLFVIIQALMLHQR